MCFQKQNRPEMMSCAQEGLSAVTATMCNFPKAVYIHREGRASLKLFHKQKRLTLYPSFPLDDGNKGSAHLGLLLPTTIWLKTDYVRQRQADTAGQDRAWPVAGIWDLGSDEDFHLLSSSYNT